MDYIDITSSIQRQRGVINFIENKPELDREDKVEYIIYTNGKLRKSKPGLYMKSMGISFDLGKSIENIDELNIVLSKLYKRIK